MLPPSFAPPALALAALVLQPAGPAGDGPQPGRVAPPFEAPQWIRTAGAPSIDLADLRGRVVVVHTFAWNCSSCLKEGIPLAVDLQTANRDDLTVLSVTTPAYLEETNGVLERFRVEHPVALEHPMGPDNPYVDVSVNSITYMFVIGRSGELVWRGDPSSKEDEAREALRDALLALPGRALDRPLHDELGKAVRSWFAGEYDDARRAAAKILDRNDDEDDPDERRIAADAKHLLERLDALPGELLSRLEAAREEGDALTYLRYHRHVAEHLDDHAVGERAEALHAEALEDAAFAAALETAEAWLELLHERPPTFPARRNREAERFADDLEDFVEDRPDAPYAERARAWLAAFEEAEERD